jgi:cell division initiation protein
MLASEDVRRVTFERVMRGYRCDDVDDYLKQVADSLDSLAQENDDLQKKLQVLAQRIEQYRAEEDTLHTALINAQRLGENVIKEAKQKAAEVIRSANMKAEDREQRARDEVDLSKQELTTLKKETTEFKKNMLDMYRRHIELLSKLPEYNAEGQEAIHPADTYSTEDDTSPAIEEDAPKEPAAAEASAAAKGEPAAEVFDTEEDTPTGEEKVDTVEFAIAPHEGAEQPPAAAPRQEASGGSSYENPFQPGAGLYDIPKDDESDQKARQSHAKTSGRVKKKKEDNSLPSSFDSFSGIDFDS